LDGGAQQFHVFDHVVRSFPAEEDSEFFSSHTERFAAASDMGQSASDEA
jgi:hypothetical protein